MGKVTLTPRPSYLAVNGESISDSAYSASGCLHLIHLLNSEAATYLVDSEISFMSSTGGTRNSEKQKKVQIREGVGSNTLRTAGPVSPPGRVQISEKGPGAAEGWALSDYKKMGEMDENYQPK